MSSCPHSSRISKEEAIYGVFYVGPEPPDEELDSSDSDYDFGYSKGEGKNLSDQQDAFISSHAQKEKETPKFKVIEVQNQAQDQNKEKEEEGPQMDVPITGRLKREQKALQKGFEKKYTKGLKMFKKWGGVVGKGIGKDKKGMVAPLIGVEANVGGGLGYKEVKKKATDVRQNERLIKFSEKLANKSESTEIPGQTEESEVIPFYCKGLKPSEIYEKGISMKDFRQKILRGEKNLAFQNLKVVDLAGNQCSVSKGIHKEDQDLSIDQNQIEMRKSQIELQALFHKKDYHVTRKLQLNQELNNVQEEKKQIEKKMKQISYFHDQVSEVLNSLQQSQSLSAMQLLERP